jgi:hypothetical protein
MMFLFDLDRHLSYTHVQLLPIKIYENDNQ